jgi:NAD+ synthase
MDRNNQHMQREIIHELGVGADFDASDEVVRRIAFLERYLVDNRCTTYVLGISGGIDSATAGRLAQLAVEALRGKGGEAQFIAMRLPYGAQEDEAQAQQALHFIGADRVVNADIQPASDALFASLDGELNGADQKQRDFLLGNIKSRQRMIAQYALAGAHGGLVVGTNHAAEAVMGFFTKYGDSGYDLAPLAGLNKRRVRAIAQLLGAPPNLVSKVPTADLENLAPQKPDEEAFHLSYDEIDDFLEGKPVSDKAYEKIVDAYRKTLHKRELPAVPDRKQG